MALDQNSIEELKEIYFAEFGQRLSDKEAWDMGINLINLFKCLLSEDDDKINPKLH